MMRPMQAFDRAEQALRELLTLAPEHARSSVSAALEHLCRARATSADDGMQDLSALSAAELAVLVRQQRDRAGLSQGDLARLAGLSKRTVQYVEEGAHAPAQDTLERLLSVAQLGLRALLPRRPGDSGSVLPVAVDGPDSYLLPLYNRRELLRDMRARLNDAGGALEQTMLYLDEESVADWLALCNAPGHVARFRGMPLDHVAEEILRCGARLIDLNALGSGDGRSEVGLCEELLQRAPDLDLRLHLLDISHSLLIVANDHAREALGKRVQTQTLHGNFHFLSRFSVLLPMPGSVRRRVYALFGWTMSNLDNDVTWIRDHLRLAAVGDFLLLDIGLTYAHPSDPDAVRALDPVLASSVPEPHARWFTGPARRYCRDFARVDLEVELHTYCPMPGSYELDIYGRVERIDGSRQRYLLARSRRYSLPELRACLEAFGWTWRWHQAYGPQDQAALVLVERTTAGT